MTRAQETANQIAAKFPDVTRSQCSLLREGAPYPLEPKSSVWHPLDKVGLFLIVGPLFRYEPFKPALESYLPWALFQLNKSRKSLPRVISPIGDRIKMTSS